MTREEVISLLSSCRDDLVRLGVRSLALFGSTARGEHTAESDIDLLVDFGGRGTFDRYADLALFLEERLGPRIDLVTQGALEASPLRTSIQKDACYVPGLPAVP
jgi:uncharacterized protein